MFIHERQQRLGKLHLFPPQRRGQIESAKALECFAGKLAPRIDQPQIAGASQVFAFTWASDGGRHTLRANVRNADGKLVLIGNPIYVNRTGAAAKP